MMTKTDQLAESPLIFIYGEDEYSVKELSQELFDQWRARYGETDAEVIEAGASNSQEALKALDRMEGALRTLPFSEAPSWSGSRIAVSSGKIGFPAVRT